MTKMNNATSSIIYCGLVAGYQGEGNTATPENAATAVAEALVNLGVDGVTVNPAVCVYHTDWNCPKGGEPAGAFILQGEPIEILKIAEALRVALKQSTLSVGLPEVGAPTIGFQAEAEGTILKIGALWQKAAAEQMDKTGTYVSCGMAEIGEGKILISAEANTAFVQDLDAWQNIVETICSEVGAEPAFSQVGFNYLQNAE